MSITSLPLVTWLVLIAVSVLVGLDKSFLPGAAIVGVGFLASVIPAKEASGVTLALIIVADWSAIWAYRGNVDWSALRRLLPNVAVGVVVGAAFLFAADDALTGRTIGVIILVFVSANAITRMRERHRARGAQPLEQATGPEPSGAPSAGRHRFNPKSTLFGVTAGFTTMVANAGGPVTAMYFLSEKFPVARFLGTTAWFYLILNLVKLPFSVGLGLLTVRDLPIVAVLAPVIVATVLLGRWLSRRVRQGVFTVLVIILSALAGVLLLV